MARNRTYTGASIQLQPKAFYCLSTASGMLALALGWQGTAANALGDLPGTPVKPNEPTDLFEETDSVTADIDSDIVTDKASPVEPAALKPRFSQLNPQAQQMLLPDTQSSSTEPIKRLEDYRRDLHRRSNMVESRLLGLQQLLSIQAYGTSFADELLFEDETYQTKIRQLQITEAKILQASIIQTEETTPKQLHAHFQNTDQELRQIAQMQLQRYIKQAQTTSTLGLWQEPMYLQSLRLLMEHTNERHQLQARQQILAQAIAQLPQISAASSEAQF